MVDAFVLIGVAIVIVFLMIALGATADFVYQPPGQPTPPRSSAPLPQREGKDFDST